MRLINEMQLIFESSEFAEEFATKKVRIDSLNPILNIGVIGEFSAGKSTLLNALLGLQLLPKSAEPTTGHITIIEPSNHVKEPTTFQRVIESNSQAPQTEDQAINVSQFNTLVLKGGDFIPVIKIPPSKSLPLGFHFIDTPGLESLNDSHTIALLNNLNNLDCILICLDINRGGLSNSLVELLKRPDLVLARQNMIFVLTKSDFKPPKARTRVVEQLSEQFRDSFAGTSFAKHLPSIVAVSAHEHIQGQNGGVLDLLEIIQNQFFAQLDLITSRRKESQLLKLIEDTLYLLKDRYENSNLDLTELEQKTEELKKQKDLIRQEELTTNGRLSEFRNKLLKDLEPRVLRYVDQISSAIPEHRELALQELPQLIQERTSVHLKAYVEDSDLGSVSLGPQLQAEIEKIYLISEQITAMISGLLFAVATGGSGSVVTEIAEVVAVPTLKQFADSDRKEGFIGILQGLASNINQVNPLEHISEFITVYIARQKAEELLSELCRDHAQQVTQGLELHYHENVFPTFKKQLDELQENIEQARTERSQARDAFVKQQQERSRIIAQISAYLQKLKDQTI